MITISTAHIDGNTARLFDSRNDISGVAVYPKAGCGWFLYIDNSSGSSGIRCIDDIIKYAKDKDCEVVCLDCDGERVEGLSCYEW